MRYMRYAAQAKLHPHVTCATDIFQAARQRIPFPIGSSSAAYLYPSDTILFQTLSWQYSRDVARLTSALLSTYLIGVQESAWYAGW